MGSDIKQIKNRIKSVDSTLHITKAMKLVASSKIHRAEVKYKSVRVYADTLFSSISDILSREALKSPFVTPISPSAPHLFIIIEADRGMAGSYNGNISRMATKEYQGCDNAVLIPIGKRACDFVSRRGYSTVMSFQSSEYITEEDIQKLIKCVNDGFENGQFSEVTLIYTKYKNALIQFADAKKILPLTVKEEANKSLTLYEPNLDSVLKYALPMYIGSILRSSLAESNLAEHYARRNAMDSASKNADEMIGKLNLAYNRARQNTITQEITEIVAGANAESV